MNANNAMNAETGATRLGRVRELRRRHGFTLLEIMVVVAIMGLMSSLAVVSANGFMGNAKSNGEAENIAEMIRMTRLRAIASGCAHVVRYRGYGYATTPGTLTIYRKTSNCVVAGPADLVFATGDMIVNTVVLTPNMTVVGGTSLTAASVEIGVNADGTSFTGSNGSAWSATSIDVSSSQSPSYTRSVVLLGAGNVSLQ